MKTFFFILKEFCWGTINAFLMITAGVLIAGFFIYQFQTPSAQELSSFHPHHPISSNAIVNDQT